MKFVVTGGAGFIGSNTVDLLINNNHTVCVLDNFSTGKQENCNPKAEYHNFDISDSKNNEEIKSVISGADGIFHLAALARVQDSIENPVHFEINNTLK